MVKRGLPRCCEAIPRTGVLFTERGVVPQDDCHCKVRPNQVDAEHGVCWELDLVVIHFVPCLGLPCREVTHVQHDAVCIYVDVAVESGCAAAGVAASVSGCAAAAAGVAAVVCGCAAAAR